MGGATGPWIGVGGRAVRITVVAAGRKPARVEAAASHCAEAAILVRSVIVRAVSIVKVAAGGTDAAAEGQPGNAGADQAEGHWVVADLATKVTAGVGHLSVADIAERFVNHLARADAILEGVNRVVDIGAVALRFRFEAIGLVAHRVCSFTSLASRETWSAVRSGMRFRAFRLARPRLRRT